MSSETIDRGPEDEADLIGAADIVAAFTALRHELKLQVRAGRDLAAGLEGLVDGCLDQRLGAVTDRLSRLETTLQAVAGDAAARPAAGGSTEAIRPLAAALAEVEESLERAVVAIATEAEAMGCVATDTDQEPDRETACVEPPDPAAAWDSCLVESSWLVRTLAARLVARLRQIFDSHLERAAWDGERRTAMNRAAVAAAATSLVDAGQGLELVLVRTRRLMEQAGLRRIDVLHQPFDGEQMRAIDITADPAVPEGHVARQFRPGYLLHGMVLRPAEVGVSRCS
ncbi:nucleotide exchange factor GrpE [bacterium]|nr:nucleotide exchange factor GrpE [bacterium]